MLLKVYVEKIDGERLVVGPTDRDGIWIFIFLHLLRYRVYVTPAVFFEAFLQF